MLGHLTRTPILPPVSAISDPSSTYIYSSSTIIGNLAGYPHEQSDVTDPIAVLHSGGAVRWASAYGAAVDGDGLERAA